MAWRPITYIPGQGGQLITTASADKAGMANYTVKRNWRRQLGDEIRREGWDWFYPVESRALGNQPFPYLDTGTDADELTNFHEMRGANGRRILLAATPKAIFRFTGDEQPDYVLDVDSYYYLEHTLDYWSTNVVNYPDGDARYVAETGSPTPYFSETAGDYPVGQAALYVEAFKEWLLLGRFSGNGHRWEVSELNGLAIFNNGYDLPVTYGCGDYAVTPIYELREMGVVRVGTICVYNTVLMMGDVTELESSVVSRLLDLLDGGAVTATQAGTTTVVLSGSYLTEADLGFDPELLVGKTLHYATGQYGIITEITDATHLKLHYAQTVAAGTRFSVENPLAFAPYAETQTQLDTSAGVALNITNLSLLNHRGWRVMWGDFNEPRRFGADIPCSITAGSRRVVFEHPIKDAFPAGLSVTVLGAGVNGGNLVASVAAVGMDGLSVILDAEADTTVTDSSARLSSTVDGVVGFKDLSDDNSTILRMLPLKSALVVYRDSSIFLGSYTRNLLDPFAFRGINRGSEDGDEAMLCYRYTLINVADRMHVYAGSNRFYRFTLGMESPEDVSPLVLCHDTFFESARPSLENRCHAGLNAVTGEVFWCVPGGETTAYDYREDTVSTVDQYFGAVATVTKPGAGEAVGEKWCLLSDGATVLQYGLSSIARGRWGDRKDWLARLDAEYTSTLTSGLEGFGARHSEKEVISYVPEMSSQYQSDEAQPATVTIRTADNPNGTLTEVASREMVSGDEDNLLPMHAAAHYFQDTIAVSGKHNRWGLSARTVEVSGANTRSHVKRP